MEELPGELPEKTFGRNFRKSTKETHKSIFSCTPVRNSRITLEKVSVGGILVRRN